MQKFSPPFSLFLAFILFVTISCSDLRNGEKKTPEYEFLTLFDKNPNQALTLLEYEYNTTFSLSFWKSIHIRNHRRAILRGKVSNDDKGIFRVKFDKKFLKLGSLVASEIKNSLKWISWKIANELSNNDILIRVDLMLKLMRKYYKELVGPNNRAKAKLKLERLEFAVDTIRSSLNYSDLNGNYELLISLYNELKKNYPGNSPLMKQRVGQLKSSLKRLVYIADLKRYLEYDSFIEIILTIFVHKNKFHLLFHSNSEEKLDLIFDLYLRSVTAFNNIIFECNFMIRKNKEKILNCKNLIKISFFVQMVELLKDSESIRKFVPRFLNESRFFPMGFITVCELSGKLESCLRRSIIKGSLECQRDDISLKS